jgi:diguanylate cyclase (GGDEF)-like protein
MTRRVRRLLSPTLGGRFSAERPLWETAGQADGAVLSGADLALFTGHPVGSSQRQVASRLGTALWNAFPGHAALLDRDGVVVSVNRAWRDFGLIQHGSAGVGLGQNYLQICERAVADDVPEAIGALEIVQAALAGFVPERRLDYPLDLDEGRWFRLEAVPLPGRYSGALVIHRDVSDDRQREQEWQRRALHDPLTGLANRALLADRLEHAIAGAAREPQSLAVLFVDLDYFKQVNERHGHGTGDRVLQEAARRLAGGIRTGDTIGRWGGDEFLVIAERLNSEVTAERLAERLAESLIPPIHTDVGELRIAATVGIAYHQPHLGPDELILAAGRHMQAERVRRRRPPAQERRSPETESQRLLS